MEILKDHLTEAWSEEEQRRFGASPEATFRANLLEVRGRIQAACERSGRNPEEIRLLPISKTVPSHVLRAAVAAGIREFGENKVQEAQSKAEAFAGLGLRWCVVGHLQSNKAKYLARFAAEFQALDSLKLAVELNQRLEQLGRDLDVFVQVNTSGEASKFGVAPEQAAELIRGLGAYPRLRLRGLMTLAIFSEEKARVRSCFQLLRRLRDELSVELSLEDELRELSMGMSGDYELAIEEGATVVRVGQAIFGVRPGSDAHYWPGLIPER